MVRHEQGVYLATPLEGCFGCSQRAPVAERKAQLADESFGSVRGVRAQRAESPAQPDEPTRRPDEPTAQPMDPPN